MAPIWKNSVYLLVSIILLLGCVENEEGGSQDGGGSGDESEDTSAESNDESESDDDATKSESDSDGDSEAESHSDDDTGSDETDDSVSDNKSDVDSESEIDSDEESDESLDSDTIIDTEDDSESEEDSESQSDNEDETDTATNDESDFETDTHQESETDSVDQESFNICDETVPEEHHVDGIPAYSQCDASRSSAIWSDNGLNTSVDSEGDEWVRTQWSGGYQCTEFAHRYLRFRWNFSGMPSGNAGSWCDGTLPEGLEKTMVPVHGDVIVFAPGSCGADPTTGHVAVVDVVNEDQSTVTFVEQNMVSRRSCDIDTAACFLHAIDNESSFQGE